MDNKLRDLYNRESVEAYNKFMRSIANKSAGPRVRKQRKEQRESKITIDGTTIHNDTYKFP